MKGFDVSVRETMLLALCVIFIIAALSIYIRLQMTFFKPICWTKPFSQITKLKSGDLVVNFGCIKKVIYTNDLSSVKGEIDVYKYCDKKDRMKGYGSFLILIPIEYNPSKKELIQDFLSSPIETLRMNNLKPACIWRDYGVYKEAVFEGPEREHCIHMEDYQKSSWHDKNPSIKIVAAC